MAVGLVFVPVTLPLELADKLGNERSVGGRLDWTHNQPVRERIGSRDNNWRWWRTATCWPRLFCSRK